MSKKKLIPYKGLHTTWPYRKLPLWPYMLLFFSWVSLSSCSLLFPKSSLSGGMPVFQFLGDSIGFPEVKKTSIAYNTFFVCFVNSVDQADHELWDLPASASQVLGPPHLSYVMPSKDKDEEIYETSQEVYIWIGYLDKKLKVWTKSQKDISLSLERLMNRNNSVFQISLIQLKMNSWWYKLSVYFRIYIKENSDEKTFSAYQCLGTATLEPTYLCSLPF